MEARKSRQDDALMRKTIYGLVSAILMGVIAHFMTIGKVQTVAEEAYALAKGNRALIDTHREEFYEVKIMVADTKSEARQINKAVDKLTIKVDESINNQNRIIPIVNQAQRFMSEKK